MLSPLILLIALLIKFEDNGPILYHGRRTGQFDKTFKIYRFRTMVLDAEKIEEMSLHKSN